MLFSLTDFNGSTFVTADIAIRNKPAQSTLVASFELSAELPGLAWPQFNRIHRADEIWRSTCFECFIGSPDTKAYIELNLSPSGAWNCYAFDDYRSGMRPSGLMTPDSIETGPLRLKATLGIDTSILAPEMLLGLSAILETGNRLHYFALSHANPPDFHDQKHHVLVEPNDLYLSP